MNPNNNDRATVVWWTCRSTTAEALRDARSGRGTDERFVREAAKASGLDPWRITITVERMPNDEQLANAV